MTANSLIGTRSHGRTPRASVLLASLAALLFASVAPASEIVGSARLIAEREGHTATLLGKGSVLVVGGRSSGGPTSVAEIYDPLTRTFSVAGSSLEPRADHAAVRLTNERVLVIGGRGADESLASTELFDPKTNTFSAGPFLSHARSGHTATLLADGRVVVIGGDAAGSAEIYEPATGQFHAIEDCLTVARSGHAAVLLRDGNVLVAGGIGADGAPLASAEMLNLAILSFSDAPIPMLAARSGLILRALPDGKVQVIGGDREATMELFNPAGRYFSSLGHLGQDPAVFSAALRNTGRAALIGSPASSRPALARLSAEGDGLAPEAAVLELSNYTLTELPGMNTAILVGGLTAAGGFQQRAVLFDASSATVTTDKSDYAPGQTVTITGTGWLPGETVTLNLHRDTNDPPDTVLTAVADANGNISNAEYVCQQHDLNVTFLLTATGQTSRYTAQTTFTDANPQSLTLVPTPPASVTVTAGNSAVYAANVAMGGNTNPCTLTFAVTTALPAGAVATFTPTNPITVSNVNFSTTLTITTTGSTPTGTYPFTAQAAREANCQGSGPLTAAGILVVNAPATVPITVTTSPVGRSIIVDGTTYTAPQTFSWVPGSSHTLNTTSPQAGAPGQQFVWTSWSDAGAQSHTVTVPAVATTYTANFKTQYQLTLAITAGVPSGLANISGGTTGTYYDDGTVLSLLAATPVADGAGKQWRFDNWSGDATGSTNPTSVTMSAARSVTANYVVQWQLTLAITAGVPGGLANISGGSNGTFYDAGTVLNLAAVALVADGAGKQWRFDNWSGDATGSTSPVSVTMSAARSVTANYLAQYQLTLAITAGVPGGLSNIGGGTTGTFYDDGTVLSLLAATPVADGAGKQWRFDNWSGDATGSTNPVSVTMDQARSITANYVVQWQLTLAVTSDVPGGTPNISGGTNGTYYDDGTVLSLTAATPVADGAGKQWRFDNWSGDATGSANPTSVTMSAARSITANYVVQWQLTLAITAGVPGGLANISGGSNGTFYDAGTVLNLAATTPVADVNKQWGFDNWSGDATGVSASVMVTMSAARSVTANYAYPTGTLGNNGPVAEGSAAAVSFSGQSHPFAGTASDGFRYAFSCTNGAISATYATGSATASTTCSYPDEGSYTVKGRIIDSNDGYSEYTTTVVVNNANPIITGVTGPIDPIQKGGSASISATFTDAGVTDTHTCSINWGDGNTTAGTVTEVSGSGSCSSGSHTYLTVGVYTVTVTVTDNDGGSDSEIFEYIVIFDPNGGFVTGGGWINSPAGAYGADPAAIGKANFGFVAKYKKGAGAALEGETEFQFKAGDLNFHSTSYEWMVISGAKARYRGVGTINGVGSYEFELTAWDGQVSGGGGVDKFRIRIGTVYDNQLGDPDGVDPTTAIGGGSIVIHKPK